MIKQLLVLAGILCGFSSRAQNYFGVQAGADYDTPVRSLAYRYKPVTAYHLDLLWFADEHTKTVNFTVGYNTFKPKADEFYFLTNNGEGYGTTVFSNMEIYTAYVGWMRNIALTETFKFGLGFNFGAYFSHYTSESQGGGSNDDIADTNVYLAAKTGFSYDLSEHIQLNLQAKYNGFAPTGKNDPRTPAFNGRVGTVYESWATGLAIAYKF